MTLTLSILARSFMSFKLILIHMREIETEIFKQLDVTFEQFIKTLPKDTNIKNVVLRTNKLTSDIVEEFYNNLGVNLICDIPDDKIESYRKKQKVIYKWIWTIPAIKRSYSGRIEL